MYYRYWAKLTVLTFPGAFIGWYVKKENLLSMLILSVALLILSIELVAHFLTLINKFPFQLLAVIFIIWEIYILIFMLYKDKSKRITMVIVTIIMVVALAFYNGYINRNTGKHYSLIELEENQEYTLLAKDGNIEVNIKGSSIIISGKKEGQYIVKLKNGNGEIIELSFKITKENGAEITIIN